MCDFHMHYILHQETSYGEVTLLPAISHVQWYLVLNYIKKSKYNEMNCTLNLKHSKPKVSSQVSKSTYIVNSLEASTLQSKCKTL